MGYTSGQIQTWNGKGKEARGKSWLSPCLCSRPPQWMSLGRDVLLGAPHLLFNDVPSACKGVRNKWVSS